MEVHKLIRQRRLALGLTLSDVADACGVNKATVSRWESGHIQNMKSTRVAALANVLKISPSVIIGDMDDQSVSFQAKRLNIIPVPIYDPISCGNGTWVDEQASDFVGVPDYMACRSAVYFANTAQGDSMEPRIRNGDCVVFEITEEVPSGRIGAFSLNGSYYCKVFKRLPDGSCWLFSENPAYDPIPISPEDEFRTLGLYRIHVSIEQ